MTVVAERQQEIVVVKSPNGDQVYPPKKQKNSGKISNSATFRSGANKDKIKALSMRAKSMDPKEKEIPIEQIRALVPSAQVYALADPEATKRILQGEELPLNLKEQQSENWQRYIDVLRGVKYRPEGENDPPSVISMRQFALDITGISQSTVRGLSIRTNDPDKIQTEAVIKFARCGGITEYELRQFISYSTFELGKGTARSNVVNKTLDSSIEDIESYLSVSPLDKLVQILEIVTRLIGEKIRGDVMTLVGVSEEDDLLSEANSYLLDLLDDFQKERELSEEEFTMLKKVYKISDDEIAGIERDERPSIKLVGNLARMTGTPIDTIMEVVNKSYP